MTDAERIAAELRPQYLAVRVLPDGTVVALHDLIFTRSILIDCDRDGYGARFCFADRALATRRFAELQGADDVPAGHTARRA